jgi:hypothetical protein
MAARDDLSEFGMEEGWIKEYDGAPFYYRPDFNDAETRFAICVTFS